jgi:AbiTii
MTSLVHELQVAASDPDSRVVDLLRKAKVVASKLNLTDVVQWLDFEAGGYPGDDGTIPNYRKIRGVVEGLNPVRGWMRVQFEDPQVEELASTCKTRQPIAELEALLKGSGTLRFAAAPTVGRDLEYAIDSRLSVSQSQIYRVLEAVRDRVLDWTLELERAGVTGDGLSFSPEEVHRAAEPSIHLNVETMNMTGNIGNISGRATIRAAQSVGFRVDGRLAEALSSIRDSIRTLPPEERREAEEQLDVAEEEARSKAPRTGRISSALKSIGRIVRPIAGVGGKAAIEAAVEAGIRALLS